jgi:hypothetical protein
MPAAPETAVYGATVRPVLAAGPKAECADEECRAVATWAVIEECGDWFDGGGYYSCDEHVAVLARLAILDAE